MIQNNLVKPKKLTKLKIQYENLKNDLLIKNEYVNEIITNLKIILNKLKENSQIQIQTQTPDTTIENIVLNYYTDFDEYYIQTLKLLYGVKIVLLLSGIEEIVSEKQPPSDDDWKQLNFLNNETETNKNNLNILNKCAKEYEESISSIENIIKTTENNRICIENVIREFINSQAPNKDLQNCAIF